MPALQKSHYNALAALLDRSPRVGSAGPVEQFILNYIYLEAVLRIVLAGYRSRPEAKAATGKPEDAIVKTVVSSSFEYFGIAVSSDQIDALLDSKLKRRGAKSARGLRNALVHEWKEEDAREVEDRSPELLGLLKLTLHAISIAARSTPGVRSAA